MTGDVVASARDTKPDFSSTLARVKPSALVKRVPIDRVLVAVNNFAATLVNTDSQRRTNRPIFSLRPRRHLNRFSGRPDRNRLIFFMTIRDWHLNVDCFANGLPIVCGNQLQRRWSVVTLVELFDSH